MRGTKATKVGWFVEGFRSRPAPRLSVAHHRVSLAPFARVLRTSRPGVRLP